VSVKLNHRYLAFATLIFLLPFVGVVWLFLNETSHEIAFTQKERLGIVQHRALFDLQLAFQDFRWESFIDAQSANPTHMTQKHRATLQQHIAVVDKTLTTGTLATTWQAVRREMHTALDDADTPRARFDRRTDALKRLHLLMRDVGNDSNLILDPELPTYYMMNLMVNVLPSGIGHIAHARGLISGLLRQEQKRHVLSHYLMLFKGKQQDFIDNLTYNMTTLKDYIPKKEWELIDTQQQTVKKIHALHLLMKQESTETLAERERSHARIFAAGTDIINILDAEYRHIASVLDDHLIARLQRDVTKWWVSLIGAIMAFLTAVGIFIFAHRSVATQEDAENARRLCESEERFNLAIAGTNDGVWDWIRIGEDAQYWSPQFKKLLGYEDHEIEPSYKDFMSRLHPDDMDRVKAHAKEHFEHNPPFNIEYRLRLKSGGYCWFRAKATTVRDETGKPVRMVGSIRDITPRKEAEERLRASEERLQLAITGSTDGLWDWNVENDEVYYSPRFMALTGHEHYDLPHTIDTFTYLLHPEDREMVYTEITRHFKERTPYSVEYRLRHRDGRDVWCHARGQASWNYEGKAIRMTGFTMDISERKASEARLIEYAEQMEHKSLELEQAKEQAEMATRLKSDFLANMSHEIRTPMNGIIGMSSLLLETDLTPQQEAYANTVIHSSEALLQIINDILDFSKIEAGKLDMEHISFDFQMLVEEVADLMAVKAHEHKIELLLRYAQSIPRFVMGDPGRVRQIFFNLISNAIKFTDSGHVLVSIEQLEDEAELSESEARSGGGAIAGVRPPSHTTDLVHYRVRIEDTGIGIPADKLDYIFNKFTQADGSTTRKFGGTGLGLAICKELSHMMGGDVGVESVQGVGSTFWFTLQLEKDTQTPQISSPISLAILQGKRVLVVDDNVVARTIITEQLREVGIVTLHASSGKEALTLLHEQHAKETPIDLAIIDYVMPEMDGVALAQQIKKSPELHGIPLVMLTAIPMRGDHQSLSDKGFAGYLPKPLNAQEMPEMLALILSQPTMRDTLLTRYSLLEYKNATKRKARQSLHCAGVQILVAEDNPINQLVVRALLVKLGVIVTIAGDGAEAVKQMKQRRFDLILMDCQMPVIDGYEAAQMIRKLEAHGGMPYTPIIALTANAMKGDDEACIAAGMDGYLTKPLKQEQLEEALSQWLPEEKQVRKNA
jgi:PAS domain S-box-containing protein